MTVVNVTAGSTTAGVGVELAERFGVISGVVTAAATKSPVVGVRVSMLTGGRSERVSVGGVAATVMQSAIRETGQLAGAAETGSGGKYECYLPPGNYVVFFEPGEQTNLLPQYWEAVSAVTEATSVSVANGSHITNVNAELKVGGSITGTVLSAAKAPLPGATVAARSEAGSGRPLVPVVGGVESSIVATASTDASGEYQLLGLPTGSYIVTVAAAGYQEAIH